MCSNKSVQFFLQERRVFANCPGDVALLAQFDIRMQNDFWKDLLPEACNVFIDYYDLNEPGIQHFDDVFVFQILRGQFENNLLLPFLLKTFIQILKAMEVTAGFTDIDLLSSEIINGIDCR